MSFSVFSWPCILRYLSMTDKYWRRCPMCFDAVQKGQLRSVQLQSVQLPPRVDATTQFQFLRRPKASLSPFVRGPSSKEKRVVRKLPTVYDEEAKYARILESTHEYLLHLAMDEMRDLEVLDAECRSSGDADTLPFVEEAMKATSQRLAAAEANQPVTAESELSSSKFQSLDGLGVSDMYSFYQQQNGCYVVLHPLNMKCLTREFAEKVQPSAEADEETQASATTTLEDAWTGAASPPLSSRAEPSVHSPHYELLPDTIEGRVLDVEHLVMDDAVQKRFRFLGHLPKFCDFYVCELDLSPLLSRETLEAFRAELKKREKQRRLKNNADKKSNSGNHSKHANGSATSPATLAVHYGDHPTLRGFSLEDGEGHWPAPSEMPSLADAFQDGLQFSSDSASSFTDQVPADSDASFATITRNSGYYPPLGGSASGAPRDVTSSPSMWGSATGPLSGSGAASPPMAPGGGKKKGAMKKGTPLFSTSQRRSYR
jgi:hypothetical protein